MDESEEFLESEYTFDEWLAYEYHVKKGERSNSRNEKGQATFKGTQVEED